VVLTARSLLSLQLWFGMVAFLHFCSRTLSLVYVIRETGHGRWSGALPDGESWRGLVVVVVIVVIVVVVVVFSCLLCFALLGDMQLPSHCLALCLLRPASSWFVLNLFWAGSVRVR
jgi:hypothetical protein